MITTELFIAIISLCITCFSSGYALGSRNNDKTQKNTGNPAKKQKYHKSGDTRYV
ncbi:MAG: hypothetical protein ACLUX8_02270 [Clostridium sp.]